MRRVDRVSRLSLTQADQARLAQWSAEAYPEEACGLLVGVLMANGEARALEVTRGPNLMAGGPRPRFTLDPVHHLGVERRAAAQGLRVLGAWHSHPDAAAEPSAEDGREADSSWCYPIVPVVGGQPGSLRCWRFADGGAREVPVSPEGWDAACTT